MGDPERFKLSITDPRVDSVFIYPDSQSVKEFARVNIRRFVSWCSRNLCFGDPILDVACGYRNNRTEIDPEFKRKFITTDLNPSLKPDFVADASKLPIAKESIGCALCTEMLEHVPSPPALITEIARILKPGGLLIVTVPFWVLIHEKGSWQLDYWRFTPRGLYQLLSSEFRDIRIQYHEHREFPVEVPCQCKKKMTIEHEQSFQTTRKETSVKTDVPLEKTDGFPINSQVPYEVLNNFSNETIKPIPRLTVVIVNFNTQDLLVNCLDSILRHSSKLSFKLSVVDNGSKDNSVAIIKEKFPEVELIASADNLGFSKANNLVLKRVNTEYLLLLNSDTLVSPGAFDSMVNFMDSNLDIGILGPKLVRPDGSFDPGSKMGFATVGNLVARKIGLTRLFPKSRLFGGYHLRNIDENKTSDVNAVAGACMLIRKDALEKVGFFDEEFFLGCEDLDYCYRTTKVDSPYGKPYRVVYYPEVTITHLGRQTRQKFPLISILEFHKSSWKLYQKYQAEDHSLFYNYLIKGAIRLTAYIRVCGVLTKLLFQKRKPLPLLSISKDQGSVKRE